jgi:pimeloyl-ACP methyl ester carboxylesterase
VVSTAFIRDFLIGEADIASFSCYSKPPASAGGAFTQALDLGTVHVAGFSDGAVVGLLLAMRHPESVRKMALLGVNLKPSDFTDECYEYVQATYEQTGDPLFKMMLEQPNIDLVDVKNVAIPTLLVAAEDDLYKPELYPALVKAMPQAELKILSRA